MHMLRSSSLLKKVFGAGCKNLPCAERLIREAAQPDSFRSNISKPSDFFSKLRELLYKA
jgi:hypothetical protein